MITTIGLLITTCLSFGNTAQVNGEDNSSGFERKTALMDVESGSYNHNILRSVTHDYIYTPEIKSTMLNGGDAYEQNNLRETATRMSPLNHYEYDSYSSHLYANLEIIHGINDWDLYAIVLLTDSYVDVNADLMYTTFAFDFGITAYVSTDSTNPRDITDRYSYFIYSDDSYNVAKSFSGLLKAGTYFIEIYRKSDCPTSN